MKSRSNISRIAHTDLPIDKSSVGEHNGNLDTGGATDPQKQSRAELEQVWRTRLNDRRVSYDVSVAQCRKVLAEQKQFGMPAPDGSFAVRQAHLQESAARNEYIRVLQIFTDLVVRGTIPDED